jgi:hypothetical protein
MLQHDATTFATTLGTTLFLIGTIFWVGALLLMMRDGARARANAMPLAAICSNLGYQFYFGFVCPATQCAICPYGPVCGPAGSANMALLWTWRIWLVLQLVLFVQLWRFGRDQAQEVVIPRQFFYPMIILLLVVFYVGQATYTTFYQDFKGNAVTYVSNLMMSALFLPLLWARPKRAGLGLGAAWCKLLGSGLQAVAIILTMSTAYPNHQGSYAFIYFLFIAILLFDSLYVAALWRQGRTT